MFFLLYFSIGLLICAIFSIKSLNDDARAKFSFFSDFFEDALDYFFRLTTVPLLIFDLKIYYKF